jgi:TRAP-type mannitol/chloroaromatic compound transport system permease large subunit
VDCIDPCGRTQCPSLNSFNPCGKTDGNAYGCPAVNTNINAYRVFTARFIPISATPRIASTVVNAAQTSLQVVLTLRAADNQPVDGTVNCAAYVTGNVPPSVTDIILQNQLATSINSIATVNIRGLFPQSKYDVYCVAISTLGTLSSLSDVLKTKTPSETTGK